MSYTPNESYANISRGVVTGASLFSAYGEKTTAGADSGILWPNGTFVIPPAAGVQMSIVSSSASDSSAGTGIRTLRIIYLDNSLNQQAEIVTMNGTTPVLTVATNIAFIQCMHMVTYGSGKSAAGNISATNGGNTYSYVSSGKHRCSSSVRMVPAGKRLMVYNIFGGSSSGSGAAKAILRPAATYFEGYDFKADSIFITLNAAAYQDMSAGITFDPPLSFTAGTAFGINFEVDKAATVVGSWSGWLENV